MEITEVADELYALPPEEFTATRNERAKQARSEDRELANRIKALPKASTAAWVVNMLARHQADLLTQVLELGASLRQAQENLAGDDLRDLNRQRRQLTAAVTTQARSLAYELGVRISDTVADQVEQTLRAAMIDEGAAKAVRTGQLLDPLSATGVGDLDVSDAVAVPEAIGLTAKPVSRSAARKQPDLKVVAAEPESRPGPEPESEPEDAEAAAEAAREQALEDARQAVEEAEAAAAKAQRKLTKATKRVSRLEARSLQLQGELEELRRKIGEREHELESVDDELSSAEEKRDRATEKQASTAEALDEARAALADLER